MISFIGQKLRWNLAMFELPFSLPDFPRSFKAGFGKKPTCFNLNTAKKTVWRIPGYSKIL